MRSRILITLTAIGIAAASIIAFGDTASALPRPPPQPVESDPPPPEDVPRGNERQEQAGTDVPPITWCDVTDADVICAPSSCPEGKRTLIYYYMPGCEACTMMDRIVFSDSRVRRRLADYVMLKMDVTRAPDRAVRAGIKGTPTVALVAIGCKTGVRIGGAPERAEQFLEALDEFEKPAPPPAAPPPKGGKPAKKKPAKSTPDGVLEI